jgi:hypothetical protein
MSFYPRYESSSRSTRTDGFLAVDILRLQWTWPSSSEAEVKWATTRSAILVVHSRLATPLQSQC